LGTDLSADSRKLVCCEVADELDLDVLREPI
jgi:hypothetical protein